MERLISGALAALTPAPGQRCTCHAATVVDIAAEAALPDGVRCPRCRRLAQRVIVIRDDGDTGAPMTEEDLAALALAPDDEGL